MLFPDFDRVDFKLRDIVAESSAPDHMLESYLAFAHEYYRAVSRAAMSLPARLGPRRFPVPTQTVVAKWTGRGLSAGELWEVGSAITAWLGTPTARSFYEPES
jgi:hypothetical protein